MEIVYKPPRNVSKKFHLIPSIGNKDIMSSNKMSTNKQETGNRQTDLVLEVTPPEVGHLKLFDPQLLDLAGGAS